MYLSEGIDILDGISFHFFKNIFNEVTSVRFLIALFQSQIKRVVVFRSEWSIYLDLILKIFLVQIKYSYVWIVQII